MRHILDTAFVLLMAAVYGVMVLVIAIVTLPYVLLAWVADWIEGEE